MGNPVIHFELGGGPGGAGLRGFYAALFGWRVEPVESSGGTYAMLRTDAGEGIDGGLGTWQGVPEYVTFYVGVEDLEAALARAEELGGRRVMEPRAVGPGLSAAMFADPQGHTVGLLSGPDARA